MRGMPPGTIPFGTQEKARYVQWNQHQASEPLSRLVQAREAKERLRVRILNLQVDSSLNFLILLS
jgi:hypothetical protein